MTLSLVSGRNGLFPAAAALVALGLAAVTAQAQKPPAAPPMAAAATAPAMSAKAIDQAIKYRQAAYTVLYASFGPLGAMASGKMPYDAKAFQVRADRVAFMATITPEVFPAGTAKGGIPSKAKPEIWQDRADFDKLMKDLGDKTAALAVAAKSGSLDTIKPAFEAAAGACKACHDKYKVE